MDDSFAMGGRQSFGNPQDQRHRVGGGEPLLAFDQLLEAAAGDEFHLEEAIAAGFSDRVRGDDIRMNERGCRPPLAHKPFAVLDVGLPDAWRENLKRAVASQVLVMGQVNAPHRAAAQQGFAAIDVELRPEQFVLLLLELIAAGGLGRSDGSLAQKQSLGEF